MSNNNDPYALSPADVREPPDTWLGSLPFLGPGFVLSASIVGSGELIATTTLGAEVGFAALWVILLSCVVKVALQLEFGRHAIIHGLTTMEALNKLPGPGQDKLNWSIMCWLLIQPLKILQVGGIVGGLGLLMNLCLPQLSVATWCWIGAIVVATLVSLESYRLIERSALILLGAFTILTFVSVIALQWTEFAISGADLGHGLSGALPTGAMLVVFGAFGLTGVGGDEIMQYPYWLLEKGYASYAGRRVENDEHWERRAQGWIKIMYADALLSMVAYTSMTAAFYVLGAAVLHARDTIPEGYAMIETLAAMYTETLGGWAKGVFLLGAFTVLFSTLFSALAAWTRIFSDALAQLGWCEFHNPTSRRKTIVVLAWFFPASWAMVFLLYKEPVYMVVLGGAATSMLLLLVILGALWFRYQDTPASMKPSWFYDTALWISSLSIAALAIYGVSEVLKKDDPASDRVSAIIAPDLSHSSGKKQISTGDGESSTSPF